MTRVLVALVVGLLGSASAASLPARKNPAPCKPGVARANCISGDDYNALLDAVSGTVNVANYLPAGYVAGSTDATTYIQAAINALGARGGTVYFPPGDYRITATIGALTGNPPPGNIRLLGASRPGLFTAVAASRIITDAAIWMVQFGTGSAGGNSQHSGPVVENLAFVGGATTLGGVRLYQQNHARITNNTFEGFTVGDGVRIDGGSDASILPILSGNIFNGCKRGIATTGLITGMRVFGGYIGNPSDPVNSVGIDYSGNTAHIDADIDGHPVAVRLSDPGEAGNRVLGSRFEGNTVCVEITGNSNVVTANFMYHGSNGGTGTRLLSGALANHVFGNTYVGTTPIDDQTAGGSAGVFEPDEGSVVRRRNGDGVISYTLEGKHQTAGDDSKFIARAAGGQIEGYLGTNYAATSTVRVGSTTDHDLEFMRQGASKASVDAWGLKVARRLAQNRQAFAFGASMEPDASTGNEWVVPANAGDAFTIANPTFPTVGQRITIRIRNESAGALGAVTWGTAYKMAAWAQPAAGYSRAIDFQYDGTNWIEVSRTPADVPN